MAAADYHLCAVCDAKVFYDAVITDERYYDAYYKKQVRALCSSCAETHSIVILKKEEAEDLLDLHIVKLKYTEVVSGEYMRKLDFVCPIAEVPLETIQLLYSHWKNYGLKYSLERNVYFSVYNDSYAPVPVPDEEHINTYLIAMQCEKYLKENGLEFKDRQFDSVLVF